MRVLPRFQIGFAYHLLKAHCFICCLPWRPARLINLENELVFVVHEVADLVKVLSSVERAVGDGLEHVLVDQVPVLVNVHEVCSRVLYPFFVVRNELGLHLVELLLQVAIVPPKLLFENAVELLLNNVLLVLFHLMRELVLQAEHGSLRVQPQLLVHGGLAQLHLIDGLLGLRLDLQPDRLLFLFDLVDLSLHVLDVFELLGDEVELVALFLRQLSLLLKLLDLADVVGYVLLVCLILIPPEVVVYLLKALGWVAEEGWIDVNWVAEVCWVDVDWVTEIGLVNLNRVIEILRVNLGCIAEISMFNLGCVAKGLLIDLNLVSRVIVVP